METPRGRAALYREWKGLAWNLGKDISLPVDGTRISGLFRGVDENFGMLLKTGAETRLIPLSTLIEEH
ncbi:MAG: DUF4444 domain-containing protein [Paracoccaceae bacterium]|nr:DUF4444 domain-containing protein [Paracoccaceae bacterium]